MKNLLACLAILAAFNASAQVDGFQLPYNPDVEPDGYIGVQDVLELLQLYGSEFNAALFFDEDSTLMVMEVGQMNIFECLAACDDLPSNWRLANMTEFGHCIDELDFGSYFLKDKAYQHSGDVGQYDGFTFDFAWVDLSSTGSITLNPFQRQYMEQNAGCLCAAQERPKVEFSRCSGSSSIVEDCCQLKVQDGWYPLGNSTVTDGGQNVTHVQAFWRWAE